MKLYVHLYYSLVGSLEICSYNSKLKISLDQNKLFVSEPDQSYLSHFPTRYSKSGNFPIEIPRNPH